MLPAGDHRHPRCKVPDHLMRCGPHPVLVVVQAEVLLHDLFTCCHSDLNRSFDNRGDPFVDRFLDG